MPKVKEQPHPDVLDAVRTIGDRLLASAAHLTMHGLSSERLDEADPGIRMLARDVTAEEVLRSLKTMGCTDIVNRAIDLAASSRKG